MADLNIQVSPSLMRSKAGELKSNASNIKQYTDEMAREIESLKSAWEGTAAETFVTKFNGLRDDFQERFDVINDYAKFLEEAADEFEASESMNINKGEALLN